MRHLLTTALATTAISALTCFTSFAQTIVIKSERTVTSTSLGMIDQATILVKDGRITRLSANADYEGDTIIEGDDYWVTPGIFAPISNLGLVEVDAERSTSNKNADGSQSTASIRAADSFNPKSTSVPISRLGGVTYAAIMPNSSTDIFGGVGMIASTNGEFSSTIDETAFTYVSYSGGSDRTGRSKGAAMAYLRASLDDALNYNTRFKSPSDGDALRRADAKALRAVFNGQPLIIGADRAVDMHNIIKLKKKYPQISIIIMGAAEGWMIADELARAKVPVIIDPIENLPYGFDSLGSRADNAKLLMEAGVTTSFMSRSATGGGAQNLRLLPQHAGNAVANGVDWESAFEAISLTPATMFGHAELGRIKVGDTANFVVWDGDPLEVTSTPVAVFIDGKLQPMKSRQTLLRDRYNPSIETKPNYGYRP